ncbi:MAG: SDR family oxidoreductase [Roseovarius sp.]
MPATAAPGTVLVMGASGRFGRHAAQAFAAAGWRVRRFERDRDDLGAAAAGADVIVAAANPAYQHWARVVPALHERIRAAALASGATVLVPGNVYVFGPDSPPPWGADSPHLAQNPLGRVRREMEEGYRAAGVRTIVLRAGDFIDTAASGAWFDRLLPKSPRGSALAWPGPADAAHAWAFLPDLARAAVGLAAIRDRLARFEDVPFPGYTLSGQQIAAILSRLCGRTIGIRPFPWWQLRLARPFVPIIRHVLEMRWLWEVPHSLDGAKFAALMPGFAATPAEEALASVWAGRFGHG